MNFYNLILDHIDSRLISIFVDVCGDIDPIFRDPFAYSFLNWLKDNLGYYEINNDDIPYLKSHIKFLISNYKYFSSEE